MGANDRKGAGTALSTSPGRELQPVFIPRKGTSIAKLRHIAIAVPDVQATAKFYEASFGMHRVRESNVALMLSDGVMSLAIIDSNKNPNSDHAARVWRIPA